MSEPEQWKWVGIGSIYGKSTTYTIVDFSEDDFTVWPELTNVKNIKDLKTILPTIKHKRSPTDCYFNFDSNIFYYDSQGCVEWGLDDFGRVYIANSDEKIFVAKTLAAFVSRIFDENAKFYEQHSHIFGHQ
jgi:hypothetical protein